MHVDIEPLIITIQPWDYYYLLSLKVRQGNTEKTIKAIETFWNSVISNEPFNYLFLDKTIKSKYNDLSNTGKTFTWFSIIAIILAGLGLFGQAVFNAEQRTKEIGIRKVLGANVRIILIALSGDIAKTIVVANILAFPVAWYVNDMWLQQFAYHIKIQYWIYLVAFLLSLIIGMLTTIFQTIKAARTNPVDALKYE